MLTDAGSVARDSVLSVRNEITKCALNKPRFSAWRRLNKYGDNSSFISMTGFDRKSFQLLLDSIFPHIGGKRRGRPEALNDVDKVGFYLLYCNSTMKIKFISCIFG